MNGSVSPAARRAVLLVGLLLGAILVGQVIGLVFDWDRRGSVQEGPGVFWSIQVGLGLVFGSLTALIAIGLVLVYRTARVINFSQAGFAVGAAMLYLLLTSAWGWSWWVAVPLAVAAAAVVAGALEIFVIRRFWRSPRLVLTVVTIALAQVLAGVTLVLPRVWGFVPEDDAAGALAGLPNVAPQTPFQSWTFDWDPWVFNGNHVLAVVVAVVVMAGLAVFFRRSAIGVAVRGASENTERAEQLGISTHNLSTVIWVIVGILGALAGLLTAMITQQTVAGATGQAAGASGGLAAAVGASVLLRALAAAVIARMEDIPTAVGASIAIAMFEQSVRWVADQTAIVDAVLLAVIVVVLLLQRGRIGRVEESATSGWAATEETRGIPNELAAMPQVRAGVRRSLWVLALALVAYPWLMSPSQTNLGALYAIYGIVGISLVVLTGWAGQISLGQFGFVAVGAVVGGAITSRWGLPFPLAVIVGSALAGAVAVAVGLPALRIRGLFLAVTSLAFSVAVATVLLNRQLFGWLLPDRVDRPVFFWFDSRTDERSYYYLCLAGLLLVIFLVQGLRRSRTGRLLIAMRDNERAAQAFGVSLVRIRLTAFAVSGTLAGFAGVLFAHHQNAVSAAAFGPEQSIQMFLMAVLGGLGSVYTVLVGALYLGVTTVLVSNVAGQLLASSLGVLVILLFFPNGLGALVFRARDAWLRRIALRNRIWVPTLMGDRLKQGEEARVPIVPRLEEQGPVPDRYRLESRIGEAGASQLTKLWRF